MNADPRFAVTLVEQASVQALGDRLGPGKTSVGYEVQLAHLSPTPVGSEVTAEATLEAIEGRRLTFRVSVTDARGLVARRSAHPGPVAGRSGRTSTGWRATEATRMLTTCWVACT